MTADARTGRDRATDADAGGVIAFDNTGTLSSVETAVVGVTDDGDFDSDVPNVPPSRRAALVSVALEEFSAFGTDEAVGVVLDRESVPVRLALSNVDATEREAREAVLREETLAARTLTTGVRTLRDRLSADGTADDPPVGVQLVVDLERGRVHRVVAYTCLPEPVVGEVVDAAVDRGYDPHVVSGDAPHTLAPVAATAGIPEGNVHAYQSAAAKAATVESLRAATGGPVVMVGDYVNDRLAFERADRSVLVTHGADPDPALLDRADDVVPELAEVPDLL